MKNYIEKLKYLVFVLAVFVTFNLAFSDNTHAASLFRGAKSEACAGVQLSQASGPDCTANDESDLSRTISSGINLVSIIVGVIAVIMIIIGGIRFILSDGESSKVTTARNTILYALVGLILVAFAQVIVKFVLLRI